MEVHHRQPRWTRPHQPRLSRKGTGWCPQPKENRAARIRLRDGCPQRFGRRSRPNGVARVRRCRTSSNGAWPRPLVSSDTPSTRCPPPPPSSKGCSAERSPWPTSACMGTSASGPSTASTASSCSSKGSATTSVPVARHPSPGANAPFHSPWSRGSRLTPPPRSTVWDRSRHSSGPSIPIGRHRTCSSASASTACSTCFRCGPPARQLPARTWCRPRSTRASSRSTAIEGTLVGFWAPAYAQAVNVPGYHFHFLSEDRTFGGHVLDVRATSLVAALHIESDIHLALPRTAEFLDADLSGDTSGDLRIAEGSRIDERDQG